MATLLHHIQPWMQRSIAEAEDRLERCLSLRPPSAEPIEDTVLAALFANSEIPPPPPREHAKRRRARGTTDSAIADEDTTEGVQTTYVVGSGEPPSAR
ncbi:hypothetical protein EJD97_008940 [Solanum chilense]|uniref:Uncharacterized protein n=1 Tax=Solanum chilense TaxID=4083 RepID=A0A6N2BTK1_SOLCI|nr:hypothetical protein EJD97_008940 [Solanum chilense]